MASDSKKRSILAEWRKKRPTAAEPKTAPVSNVVPVSNGQYRIWFLQKLFPKNPFYHYSELYMVDGDLDSDRLLRSAEKVAKRHEILRTRFETLEGRVVQIVEDDFGFEFNDFDLTGFSNEVVEIRLLEIAKSEARKPFFLKTGPLTRISLIKLSNSNCALLVTMHHIITDKWSMNVFRNELAEYYQNPDADLPPLEIQFRDSVGMTQSPPDSSIRFWKKELTGASTFLELPTDRERPAVPSYRGAYLEHELPADVSSRVLDLCRETNTTPYVFLLSVYQVFLSKYTSTEDLLVGSPFSARGKVELEGLIGFFNDTVILRGKPTPDKTFREFLAETRTSVESAFQHRDVPFEEIVKTLSPERALGHNPLFQTMFIYHQAVEMPRFGEGIEISIEPFDLGVSKFDLTLYVSGNNGKLSSIFEYATDLFDEDTISRMHAGFGNLLNQILINPASPLSGYSLLDDVEELRITSGFNNTEAVANFESVLEPILANAKSNPDAPAIVYQETTISYGELVRRSSDVAAYVAKRTSCTKPVALMFAPGIEMIIAMFGVLRAGACYIPLDSEIPSGRLAKILADSDAEIIIHGTGLAGEILVPESCEYVDFETIREAFSEDLKPDPRSSAYMIYTSGSTGEPKAVAVSHRNLAVSTSARFDYYQKQPEGFLLLSPYYFDSSVAGIYWTLCAGGKLVVLPKRAEQDIEALIQTINKEGVTHTLTLPSLYEAILAVAGTRIPDSLNTVILAGEACPSGLCSTHFDVCPEVDLFNEYGPTEATVWATVHRITGNDLNGRIPIGKPIPGYRVYILDGDRNPVPIGVTGELYIAGPGVASYIESGNTSSSNRFISDFFVPQTGQFMYKTGDQCAWRDDGTIMFFGRVDNQIKLRGFRIEPEEIAFQICEFDGVREAAVGIHKLGIGSKGEDGQEIFGKLTKLDKSDAEKILSSIESMSESETVQMLAAQKETR